MEREVYIYIYDVCRKKSGTRRIEIIQTTDQVLSRDFGCVQDMDTLIFSCYVEDKRFP